MPKSENFEFLRSFGRRRGKALRHARAEAMEEVLATAGIVLPEGNVRINPSSFFEHPVKEVWLEIGFGNGEHLIHQAERNPDIGMVGCEPFINGVAALCKEIKARGIRNIRIWNDDARVLMQRLQPHSIDRMFLLHPDPWPKTRHHKRRFVQTETLDLIAHLLKDGAEFRTATDHSALAQWMLEKLYFHPRFAWQAKQARDWQTPPDDWIDTRYCNKGKDWQHTQVYLNFKHRA